MLTAALFWMATAPLWAQDSSPLASHAALNALAERVRNYQAEVRAKRPRRGGEGNRAKLPDLVGSPQEAAQQGEYAKGLLADLAKIPVKELSHHDQLTYGLIRWHARVQADESRFYWLKFPYTPYTYNLSGVDQAYRSYQFGAVDDLNKYLSLVRQYPLLMGRMTEKAKGQSERGIYLWVEQLDHTIGLFRMRRADPENSVFWVASERLAKLQPVLVAGFQANLRRVITEEVHPALDSFIGFLNGSDYRAHAPKDGGVGLQPEGKEYYRSLIRYYVGSDMPPEQVRERLNAMMEEIERDQAAIRRELGFRGTPQEFRKQLERRSDYYAKTPEEVAERYMAYMNRLLPEMPRLFCRMPNVKYAVKRLDPLWEVQMAWGTGESPTEKQRTGYYLYNASKLSERPQFPAQVLIYHELAPGHMYDDGLKLDHPNAMVIPLLRHVSVPVGNGWAEYAANLPSEIGVFQTPYERYYRRAFNSMFPGRSLADVGMNYFAESAEWARTLLRERTFMSDEEIRTSVLRDGSDWPAQILPYAITAEEFRRERDRVRRQLGSKFDIRRYNDVLFSAMGLPLETIHKHLEWFVAQEKTGSTRGVCTGTGVVPEPRRTK